MIQLKNAALESSAGKKSVHALRCLNVTLPETGLVVLTGVSGSGKTALLHLLALRETPSRGEILIGGENTARWSEARRSAWLRECAAADEALLFADLTLSENAERAAVLAGFSGRDARENAREALALLGLEGAAGVYPDRLSGEQRRLGALACALARKGRVLLLDEPADGLSAESAETVLSLLGEAAADQLVIVAARNAAPFGEDARVLTLEDGQIASDTDEDAESAATAHQSVAGASGGERLRMVFIKISKKKRHTLQRLPAPMVAVLLCRLPFAVVCLPHSARRFIVRFLPAGFLCPLLCVCRLASVVSWLPVRCVVVCFCAGCPQPASLRRRFSARRFVSAAPPSAAICEKAFRP